MNNDEYIKKIINDLKNNENTRNYIILLFKIIFKLYQFLKISFRKKNNVFF